MKRGGKIVGTAAMLSVAACGAEQGKLQIRPTPTPLAAGHQTVPVRIAEARGQFALGNVALALEAFRIALREDPGSIDAMMGIAACYDRMARFDISRRHYETALAIAPRNRQLLAAFAGSLDLQGRSKEAASVRAEIAQHALLAARERLPQPAPPATSLAEPVEVAKAQPRAIARPAAPARPMAQAAPSRPAVPPAITREAPRPVKTFEAQATPVAAPGPAATPAIGRSVTVALPPARSASEPNQTIEVAEVAIPAAPRETPLPVKPVAEIAPTAPVVAARPAPVARPMTVARLVPTARPVPAPVPTMPAAERSVAVARPPVTRASDQTVAPISARVAETPAVAKPTAMAERSPAAEVARAEPAVIREVEAKSGPRLERTSLREVALITTAAPKWRALTVKRTQRSATVRFVPLRQASMSLSGIRLLNAARVNRLAARTRSYLVGRGWSPMTIGDAPRVRARSVIFYPPERRRTAQTLSAQFGFVMTPRPGSRQITVLLGRDASRISALQASS